MRKLFAVFFASFFIASSLSGTAFAARPSSPSTSEKVGYDISYVQCGKRLPTDHYFGIVGVNGGTANNQNPCLSSQLTWAARAKAGSAQPAVQLYVNTANPGELISQITTWPTSPVDMNGTLPNNPYGDTCLGANDTACSWLYGWNRSIYTEGIFQAAAEKAGLSTTTAVYYWWLDVETMNTWQLQGFEAQRRNTAALEGFAAYYQSKHAKVGLYSTAVQWNDITGSVTSDGSNLNGLANWRPSGTSLTNAKANCNVSPLTPGGFISLTQYVQKNLDHNHSCI